MRSPVEATTYCNSGSPQHLYAVKTELVEQVYHGKSHRANTAVLNSADSQVAEQTRRDQKWHAGEKILGGGRNMGTAL